MKTIHKPTKKIARKVAELVSHGLVSGLGRQEPGQMCVEAVVNCAFGLPHNDNPPCVGEAVRAFKIKLNDCVWPSDKDRAEGMKGLAIAQLGSDTLDQMEFGKLMYLRGTQRILPFVWRREAEEIEDKSKKAEMIGWCERMEKVQTFEEARQLTAYAYAYASTYTYTSTYAYTYASASASTYASASAYAYAYAYTYAYRHELLKLTAQVGLDVLIELKSPGCKWLDILK